MVFKSSLVGWMWISALVGGTAFSLDGGNDWRQFYVERYRLTDDHAKLVNNTGDGFDALYGTRNVREVLPGLLYRGGANNSYNKHGVRPNENPLPTEGLVHLCREGFSSAVYLYPNGFGTAPHSEYCRSIRGGIGHVEYFQYDGLEPSGSHDVLQLIYKAINDRTRGPVYIHCWNGWHASGFVSAIALRQFCGFTGEEAVTYWNINTDGNGVPEQDLIRSRIRTYSIDPSLLISPAVQAEICPNAADFHVPITDDSHPRE